jgi:hypothetical protein
MTLSEKTLPYLSERNSATSQRKIEYKTLKTAIEP